MTAEEIWHRKGDEEVLNAAMCLSEYTDEGRRIIQAEVQARGLALPPLSSSETPSERTSGRSRFAARYVLAFLASAAVVMAYAFIGALVGWKHGGGALVQIPVCLAVIWTWRTVTRKLGPAARG